MSVKRFFRTFAIFILELVAMVACAFLASLAYPNPFDDQGWGIIAFFSLMPVFYVINRTGWVRVPFLGLAYGFTFYLFYNYWLSTFHPLAILLVPILKSVQYIVLFPLLKAATSLFRKHSYIIQALVYVCCLYITQQGFLGYPYGNLSAALTEFRTLIQIVDITGIWGLCGDATYRRNFDTLTRLTEEALAEDPDLVAWSETAFVPSVSWNLSYPVTPARGELTREFVDFGLSMPVPLVTGNPESVLADESLPPILDDGTYNWKKYNTVILFADGQVQETYRKQHLVPFTEHFPYQQQFPRLYQLLLENDYNWWEEGHEATVFTYDGYSFATPICFEDTFGYLSADFVARGADFLLNMSNDVWSGSVPAEVQHMQLAVFRAVENRRPLLRSTNSGISCLVSTTGEVIEPMEPFTQSWHIYEMPIYEDAGLTFYTMFPDLFAKLFIVITAGCFAYAILVGWRKR